MIVSLGSNQEIIHQGPNLACCLRVYCAWLLSRQMIFFHQCTGFPLVPNFLPAFVNVKRKKFSPDFWMILVPPVMLMCISAIASGVEQLWNVYQPLLITIRELPVNSLCPFFLSGSVGFLRIVSVHHLDTNPVFMAFLVA